MTSTELLEFAHLFFEKAENILIAKNSDYSGNDNDAFQNFKAVENNYHTKTETGFIVRMSDKMSRIASFIANGSLMVKDESVTDTLIDLANYSCLLAAYIKSKQPKKGEKGYDHFGAQTPRNLIVAGVDYAFDNRSV